jgi:hypothetical protein
LLECIGRFCHYNHDYDYHYCYKFFINGTITVSSDERTAIVLNTTERAYVLKEMRGLLEAIEAVTLEISQADMKVVSLAS